MLSEKELSASAVGVRSRVSTDVSDDLFVVNLGAQAVDFPSALGADFVGNDAVVLRVDGRAEFFPKEREGLGFKAAFEDGVLDAHTPVFADFGGAVEALGIADVVGDESEHLEGATTMAGEVAGGGLKNWKPVGG
jgi:hypothetical protein